MESQLRAETRLLKFITYKVSKMMYVFVKIQFSVDIDSYR